MTTLPISLNLSFYSNLNKKLTCFNFNLNKFLKPIKSSSFCSFHGDNKFKLKSFNGGIRRGEKKRDVKVRLNQFNGGRDDDSNNNRVLGNVVLAVGLTYLVLTDQLGWVLDTIVNIGLLAIILPIAGLVAFAWWAGQNVIQSSCPNCGKDVQIFRAALDEGVQLCPYCTQPFSVEGDEFVKESGNFTSNQSSAYGETFNGFSSSSKKQRASSLPIVDIEAEVTDVE